jgi:hypothetical protein
MAAGTTQIAVAILCRVADTPLRRNDTKRISGATHIPNTSQMSPCSRCLAAEASLQAATDSLARHSCWCRVFKKRQEDGNGDQQRKAPSGKNGASAVSIGPQSYDDGYGCDPNSGATHYQDHK